MTKVCKLCGEEKALGEFGKNHARCKECYKPIIAAQRASKMERYNAQRREHYQQNRERLLAESKERNARPEEKARKREYNLAYREANSERLKEADRQRNIAYSSSPEYRAHRKALVYQRKYKITLEQRDEMLAVQGGVCKVCGSPDPRGRDWHTDHDHSCCPSRTSCGECIRGILCGPCNTLLGWAKDDTAILQAAIAYLTKWENRAEEEARPRRGGAG